MVTVDLPRIFTPSLHANLLKARCQNTKLSQYPWLVSLCRASGEPLAVLNEDRRVVKANAVLLDLLGLVQESQLLGTTIEIKDPLDFQVREELVHIDGDEYRLVILTDSRDETKRRNLEKVFLHDILNTAGGVQGLSEVMVDAEPDEMGHLQDTVKHLADQLVDEITAQRDFLSAESGDLIVAPRPLNAGELAAMVAQRYRSHPVTEDRQVVLIGENSPVVFQSDATIVSRVLGNMVKNALEASPDASTVTLDYGRKPAPNGRAAVWFSVHNMGYIPEEIQARIFTRSFSTKGAGRGLGTYGMRLLCQRFLDGQVEFTSHPTEGTRFTVTLPFDGPCR